MTRRVVFSPEFEDQLIALYRYIADAASPEIAARYTEAIVSYCEGLRTFPHRGIQRDDIRPGLRVTNYKKRALPRRRSRHDVPVPHANGGGRQHLPRYRELRLLMSARLPQERSRG